MNIDLIIAKMYENYIIQIIFGLCNNLKNDDCRWFIIEITVIGSNPEDPGFVPSCSGIFDIWWYRLLTY